MTDEELNAAYQNGYKEGFDAGAQQFVDDNNKLSGRAERAEQLLKACEGAKKAPCAVCGTAVGAG